MILLSILLILVIKTSILHNLFFYIRKILIKKFEIESEMLFMLFHIQGDFSSLLENNSKNEMKTNHDIHKFKLIIL